MCNSCEQELERKQIEVATAPHNKPYYITTPIYYTSAKLHIGNTYCTVVADTIARYKRLRGYQVHFLTGTDEHGQKIALKAQESGKNPKDFVDELVTDTKDLWKQYNISYDQFIRTTDQDHKTRVQAIFQALYDKGDIYKGEYEGWYCTPCESFWTETQLDPNHLCPDCKRPVEKMNEESYFFRLSKYEQRLKDWYSQEAEAIAPASRANEMIKNFLNKGLSDLSVSRTNFTWGIQVPFDPKHVIYVWIDALSNYITALKYSKTGYIDRDELLKEAFAAESIGQAGCACNDDNSDLSISAQTAMFKKYWPCDLHLVGKEIYRFHTIIWPALLMALDLPLPKKIFGHGWLLFDNDKMSKSKGNVIDPRILADRYSVDAIRYFLLREGALGSDFSYTSEKLINRINADLANDLGNLLSRTIAMVNKYFASSPMPNYQTLWQEYANELSTYDKDLLEQLENLHYTYCQQMDKLEINTALQSIFKVVSRANKYIDETTPWLLAKDESQQNKLAFVLYQLLEVLARSAYYISPVMPETGEKIMQSLALKNQGFIDWFEVDNKLFRLVQNHSDFTNTAALFPRLDLEKEQEYLESCLDKNKQKEEKITQNNTQNLQPSATIKGADVVLADKIEYDDFAKLALKVGEIKDCKKVEKADKLLEIQLEVAGEYHTVLSGIAPYYQASEIIGKKVVWLSNLKPRKIRGILSHGMLLCSEDKDGNVKLVEIDQSVPTGSTIS